ncbi:MAG: 16S rRNA (guanine(527)-N(7))-methyltransferase RsmG [Saccharofermentanales bacterium]|jgi:16S rRNA (guanine527-N7)-methyltransferase
MDRALIERAAEACGVTLTASMIDRVIRYIDMLQAANQTTNLTAITDPEAIATKHLEDSWRLVRHVPPKASLIDVGTGAGFPGLALKIVRPDLDVTLIDATNKKVRFLRSVTEALCLECVRALHARAEELSRTSEHRDRYDIAVARAVTRLPILAELCLPLVRPGGMMIAMKGIDDETRDAARAVRLLGGRTARVEAYELTGDEGRRSLVFIDKRTATPKRFPRRMATISKKPL